MNTLRGAESRSIPSDHVDQDTMGQMWATTTCDASIGFLVTNPSSTSAGRSQLPMLSAELSTQVDLHGYTSGTQEVRKRPASANAANAEKPLS
jgi:hypothetical protein